MCHKLSPFRSFFVPTVQVPLNTAFAELLQKEYLPAFQRWDYILVSRDCLEERNMVDSQISPIFRYRKSIMGGHMLSPSSPSLFSLSFPVLLPYQSLSVCSC